MQQWDIAAGEGAVKTKFGSSCSVGVEARTRQIQLTGGVGDGYGDGDHKTMMVTMMMCELTRSSGSVRVGRVE